MRSLLGCGDPTIRRLGGTALRLFAYGTLEFPEVWERVTGRPARGEPAVLEGYARFRVRGAPYPAIVEASGQTTPGTLYAELDDACLAILDRYEGPLYERRSVEVRAALGGRVAAFTYALRPEHRGRLSDQLWDPGALRSGATRD